MDVTIRKDVRIVLTANIKKAPFKCVFCKKVFLSEDHLAKHKTRRHGYPTGIPKPFTSQENVSNTFAPSAVKVSNRLENLLTQLEGREKELKSIMNIKNVEQSRQCNIEIHSKQSTLRNDDYFPKPATRKKFTIPCTYESCDQQNLFNEVGLSPIKLITPAKKDVCTSPKREKHLNSEILLRKENTESKNTETQTIINTSVAISQTIKEIQINDNIEPTYGSIERFQECDGLIANYNGGIMTFQEHLNQPESTSTSEHVLPLSSQTLNTRSFSQTDSKDSCKSVVQENLLDLISKDLKVVCKETEIFTDAPSEVRSLVENSLSSRLRDVGVDPNWETVTDQMAKKTDSLLQTKRKSLQKNVKCYSILRKTISEEVDRMSREYLKL